MSTALILGILASLLIVAGYIIYALQVIRNENLPNGATWLMWAYGIFVFFFIEFDVDAPLSILLLPGFETLAALGIAGYAFYRTSYIPPDKQDYYALSIDVLLLVSYLLLLYLVKSSLLLNLDSYIIGLVFLILTSLSTITSFIPILRSTYQNPRYEQPLPWLVWGTAYTILLIAALFEQISWHFYIYPILNLVLHYGLGFLTLRNDSKTMTETTLCITDSKIHGKGLHASISLNTGDHIEFISGVRVMFKSNSAEEASSIPTWYGVSDIEWIDPGKTKFRFLNHSCNPNAAIVGTNELIARRPITKDEEVTIDYSMTDADENWILDYPCNCGSDSCRKEIKSIQSLPVSVVQEHMPHIPQFFIDTYKITHPDVTL